MGIYDVTINWNSVEEGMKTDIKENVKSVSLGNFTHRNEFPPVLFF